MGGIVICVIIYYNLAIATKNIIQFINFKSLLPIKNHGYRFWAYSLSIAYL